MWWCQCRWILLYSYYWRWFSSASAETEQQSKIIWDTILRLQSQFANVNAIWNATDNICRHQLHHRPSWRCPWSTKARCDTHASPSTACRGNVRHSWRVAVAIFDSRPISTVQNRLRAQSRTEQRWPWGSSKWHTYRRPTKGLRAYSLWSRPHTVYWVSVLRRIQQKQVAYESYRAGASVDYTQRSLNEDAPDEEKTKIIQAMEDCKISIVTKMRSSSTGTTRHITSIWALSSDRSVRLKQQCELLPRYAVTLTDADDILSGRWHGSCPLYCMGKDG